MIIREPEEFLTRQFGGVGRSTGAGGRDDLPGYVGLEIRIGFLMRVRGCVSTDHLARILE